MQDNLSVKQDFHDTPDKVIVAEHLLDLAWFNKTTVTP